MIVRSVAFALLVHVGSPLLPAAPTYRDVLISGVPHVKQKPDFCGEACSEMYLRKLGEDIDQDDVFNASGINPLEGRGCHTGDLARALRRIGFEVGRVWHTVNADAARPEIEELWGRLHSDLLDGIPSIVCTRYDARPRTTEHFRLILGYDSDKDEVIYHEPAEAGGAYRRMKRPLFLGLWPLKYGKDHWTVIRLKLSPRTLTSTPLKSDGRFSPADYAQHVRKLKEKLPAGGFTVLLEPPFVVIGDEPSAAVKRRAANTVRWSVRRLKKAYFEKDPEHIIDIWLFRDKRSYRKHAKLLFGSEPSTPFGYFSREHRALIMNIATGGGTLVHEIVHPFIAANFPDCPAWFNEGLGSLYEQCADRGGRIHGLTNWRLEGLKKAIRAGSVPSFKTLTSTTTHQFYEEDPGTNYSQARYLCYYLQEKGLLETFYRRFRARRRTDPTGLETLRSVLGAKDMESFQKDWENFVLSLRYP